MGVHKSTMKFKACRYNTVAAPFVNSACVTATVLDIFNMKTKRRGSSAPLSSMQENIRDLLREISSHVRLLTVLDGSVWLLKESR